MVVDEKGKVVGCDHLTAWLAAKFLARSPGAAIVYDLRSSRALPEMIKEAGGVPVKSRVGHVFMKEKMREHDAVFGGELSGHFYFRDNFYADSGAIALAAVATQLVAAKATMSEQVAPARRYVQSGEINFETEDKEMALDDLKRAYPDATVDELDGITLNAGAWWCNVRASNTEPLLRLNLEGPDAATVAELISDVSRHLGTRVAH